MDVERVTVQPVDQVSWTLELAAGPPAATDREPGLLIAYGLVLDTTGDGVADYVVGIDNDTPVQGDFHVWLTDLATGGTHERFGPPYGFPIETWYPDVPGSTTMLFTFLLGTAPRSLDPETVRFYVVDDRDPATASSWPMTTPRTQVGSRPRGPNRRDRAGRRPRG